MKYKIGFAQLTAELVIGVVCIFIMTIIFILLINVDIQFEVHIKEIKTNTDLKRVLITLVDTPTDVFIEQIKLGELSNHPERAQEVITQLQAHSTIGDFFSYETKKQVLCDATELINNHPIFQNYHIQPLKESTDPWDLRVTDADNPNKGEKPTEKKNVPFYTITIPTPTKEVTHIRITENNRWKDAGGLCS